MQHGRYALSGSERPHSDRTILEPCVAPLPQYSRHPCDGLRLISQSLRSRDLTAIASILRRPQPSLSFSQLQPSQRLRVPTVFPD